MIKPSHADAFEVLCLQAADEGRGPILFGDCVERVRSELRPFMCSVEFPSVYLEYPLAGDPFLDVTVLYGALLPGTRIQSSAAAGTESMLDWYAPIHDEHSIICVGFELDTKHPTLQPAAVHFQPRMHTELVMPFCETIGEEERGRLYL